jgi:hypothetical protein
LPSGTEPTYRVPSKFYGIAAAGEPVIFIGDTDGEAARLVRRHACGPVIAPGDAATALASSTPTIDSGKGAVRLTLSTFICEI